MTELINSKNNNVRMKLQLLQMIQIVIECKIMVGCRWWVYVCVGCAVFVCIVCGEGGVCMCMCRVACCACVEMVVRAC